ncbi:MAG: sensor domain-containing diguanylate cyclase [Lachnospiraceae bacterium]|nr:sensor domain-containing diguanylate cyclase [Lachnospiraceae bacterium]MBR5732914.1 sensor domain-containing diguanylate cyclase [Lachnospiraceae bacterium]
MNNIIIALAEGLPQTTIITISVSVLAVIIVAGFGFFMWTKQQNQIDRFLEINRLTNKIGAGIFNFVVESGFVSYASDSFYEILGITKEEFSEKYDYDFYRFIGIKDPQTIIDSISENGDLIFEFAMSPGPNSKITSPAGRARWFKLSGNRIMRRGHVTVSAILIDIDDDKRKFGVLENKAMRDPMTGAFNKEYTKLLINRYISEHSNSSGMLLLVDIDKFKSINDTYGHLMGDNVIIDVVKSVTAAFRSNDIIGRIGGDEFVVFVCDVKDPQAQFNQARKLHEVLRRPLEVDGQTISKSASIGIALYPQHAADYDKLLECADKALYKVKGSGRDSFIIYGND